MDQFMFKHGSIRNLLLGKGKANKAIEQYYHSRQIDQRFNWQIAFRPEHVLRTLFAALQGEGRRQTA
eukprot:1889798-Amphidinium_carterae.1